MDYAQILTIILGSAAIITYIVNVVKAIINPNKKQDEDIVVIKKDIDFIKNDIDLIRENHLNHIEDDIAQLKSSIIRINTILEERFNVK